MTDTTFTPPTTPQEALTRAADLIVERGHAHGEYRSETGALCMVGALRVACFGNVVSPTSPTAIRNAYLVYSAARALVGDTSAVLERGGGLVTTFNDRATQDEAVAALRAAARAS